MNYRKILIAVGSMAWMMGCQAEPEAQDELDLSSQVSAIVEARQGDIGETLVTVALNDKFIEVAVSDESGLERFDAGSAQFSAEEIQVLKESAQNYYDQHIASVENPATSDVVAFQVLDYLSMAPVNHVIKTQSYHYESSLKNEGVTCIKIGSTVKAEWSTKAKSYVSESIVVGSNFANGYGCMGRCGAGCGSFLPKSWTKDCLDHDACSFHNNTTGGKSDPNCGDEFNEAQDDWFKGVLKGCHG